MPALETKLAPLQDVVHNRAVPARKTTPDGRQLPLRQLAQFWNWIPAFRAVAEARGVHEAARLLRVSPSTLSRSVGLLEAALGESLFFRDGGLSLTARGERFLAATRDAMRLLHEASLPESLPARALSLAATSRLGLHRLLPALHEIRRRWPDVELRMSMIREEEVGPFLLRGECDLVVCVGSIVPRHLVGVSLPPASSRVYCGRGHPLFAEKSPSEERIQSYAFAARLSVSRGGQADDSWPDDRPRRVGLACDSLEPAVDACERGELLACLPDEIVQALGLTSKLRALALPQLAPTLLQCIHRPAVGSRSHIGELVATMLHVASSSSSGR
jgi:DNA-binding transcriptional LysR family regulator